MSDAIRWPARAYVPGRTPRHPDGAFDDIRETAEIGMAPEVLAQSAAMRHGLAYLQAGFHWEAHEVLEPIWLILPDGPERSFVQGLIQTANGFLKIRMGRPKAARRLAEIASAHFAQAEGAQMLGVETRAALEWVAELGRQVNAK